MGLRKDIRAGFTLVELMIVVVILAILAIIVIPKFTNATDTAKRSGLVTQLKGIREQLEIYKLQHNGDYPTLTQMFGNLTSQTEVDGSVGNGSGDEVGPYLDSTPANPFTGGVEVKKNNNGDWEYTPETGAIRAVVPADQIAKLNLSSADAVAAK